jgi:hypothetical protein
MSRPSSFCSDASSCGKSSPHPSSIGLRRSTVDLSLLDFSGRPSENSLSSGSSQIRIASDTFDLSSEGFHQRQIVHDHVKRNYHRGIESIIKDTFFDPLRVIDIANLCSIVLSLVLDMRKPEHNEGEETADANSKANRQSRYDDEPNAKRQSQYDDEPEAKRQSQYDDESDDDLFSPCQVKITNPDTNDDWDYFADFQEQMDDHFSFSPFAKKSTKVLDTLNESEEEDASGEAEFF